MKGSPYEKNVPVPSFVRRRRRPLRAGCAGANLPIEGSLPNSFSGPILSLGIWLGGKSLILITFPFLILKMVRR